MRNCSPFAKYSQAGKLILRSYLDNYIHGSEYTMTTRSAVERAHGSCYAPFKGLSAWFSSSVHPKAAKTWKRYGGEYASENTADYLFSDDATSKDTIRVYDEQRDKGIVFFVSAWINDVVRQKLPPEGVAIGKYFLPPSTAYWHGQRKCEPSRGPKAIHDPPPSTTEHRSDHSEQELQEARAGTVAPQGKELEARDMGVLWEELERSVEMVDIETMVHVDQLELDQVPVFDFVPQLGGNHMQHWR